MSFLPRQQGLELCSAVRSVVHLLSSASGVRQSTDLVDPRFGKAADRIQENSTCKKSKSMRLVGNRAVHTTWLQLADSLVKVAAPESHTEKISRVVSNLYWFLCDFEDLLNDDEELPDEMFVILKDVHEASAELITYIHQKKWIALWRSTSTDESSDEEDLLVPAKKHPNCSGCGFCNEAINARESEEHLAASAAEAGARAGRSMADSITVRPWNAVDAVWANAEGRALTGPPQYSAWYAAFLALLAIKPTGAIPFPNGRVFVESFPDYPFNATCAVPDYGQCLNPNMHFDGFSQVDVASCLSQLRSLVLPYLSDEATLECLLILGLVLLCWLFVGLRKSAGAFKRAMGNVIFFMWLVLATLSFCAIPIFAFFMHEHLPSTLSSAERLIVKALLVAVAFSGVYYPLIAALKNFFGVVEDPEIKAPERSFPVHSGKESQTQNEGIPVNPKEYAPQYLVAFVGSDENDVIAMGSRVYDPAFENETAILTAQHAFYTIVDRMKLGSAVYLLCPRSGKSVTLRLEDMVGRGFDVARADFCFIKVPDRVYSLIGAKIGHMGTPSSTRATVYQYGGSNTFFRTTITSLLRSHDALDKNTVFGLHDATTFSGSSGSPIIQEGKHSAVVGIHIGSTKNLPIEPGTYNLWSNTSHYQQLCRTLSLSQKFNVPFENKFLDALSSLISVEGRESKGWAQHNGYITSSSTGGSDVDSRRMSDVSSEYFDGSDFEVYGEHEAEEYNEMRDTNYVLGTGGSLADVVTDGYNGPGRRAMRHRYEDYMESNQAVPVPDSIIAVLDKEPMLNKFLPERSFFKPLSPEPWDEKGVFMVVGTTTAPPLPRQPKTHLPLAQFLELDLPDSIHSAVLEAATMRFPDNVGSDTAQRSVKANLKKRIDPVIVLRDNDLRALGEQIGARLHLHGGVSFPVPDFVPLLIAKDYNSQAFRSAFAASYDAAVAAMRSDKQVGHTYRHLKTLDNWIATDPISLKNAVLLRLILFATKDYNVDNLTSLYSDGAADLVSTFLKFEPHTEKKVSEGRYRLIFDPTVVTYIVSHMLTNGLVLAMHGIDKLQKTGIVLGVDLVHDNTAKVLLQLAEKLNAANDVVTTDRSLFDFSYLRNAHVAIAAIIGECATGTRAALTLYRKMIRTLILVQLHPMLVLGDGKVIQPVHCVNTSGDFLTYIVNCLERLTEAEAVQLLDFSEVALTDPDYSKVKIKPLDPAKLGLPFPYGITGDDCIEGLSKGSDVDALVVRYRLLGLGLTDVRVWKPGQFIEFASTLYSNETSLSLNVGKSLLNFLKTDPATLNGEELQERVYTYFLVTMRNQDPELIQDILYVLHHTGWFDRIGGVHLFTKKFWQNIVSTSIVKSTYGSQWALTTLSPSGKSAGGPLAMNWPVSSKDRGAIGKLSFGVAN